MILRGIKDSLATVPPARYFMAMGEEPEEALADYEIAADRARHAEQYNDSSRWPD